MLSASEYIQYLAPDASVELAHDIFYPLFM